MPDDHPALRSHARVLVCTLACLSVSASACDEFEPPGGATTGGAEGTPAPGPDADGEGVPDTPTQDQDRDQDQPGGDAGVPATAPRQDFLVGQAGRDHIFVPNPEEGSVTVLTADNLAARQVRAGRKPSLVAAHPDHNVAVALDIETDRAFVIDTDGDAAPPAVDVLAGVNALSVGPRGRHAIAYSDAAYAAPADAPGPARSLSVIELGAEPRARSVSVQQQPLDVMYSRDGERAYVHGDLGVSRLVLADIAEGRTRSAAPWDFEALADGPIASAVVARDGDVALVSLEDAPELLLVELSEDRTRRLALADLPRLEAIARGHDRDAGTMDGIAPAEALAISDDGERALVALNDLDTLLFVSLPDAFDAADGRGATLVELTMSDTVVLAVSPDGDVGAVVDNGLSPPRLTLVDLDEPEATPREVSLAASAVEQTFAREGQVLVLTHHDADAALYAHTLVIPETGDVGFRETGRAPVASLISQASEALWVLLPAQPSRAPMLERTDFEDLTLTRHPLPQAVVALGEARGAERTVVHHAHTAGRITTIAWEGDDPLQTATGFSLVDRVRE